MALTLEVVSPRGVVTTETGLDRVVVRRREAEHEPGSEIAILPRHGPLLMQTQPCAVRVMRGSQATDIAVGAGVLEVVGDRVTLILT